MSGNVNIVHSLIHDIRAALHELVYNLINKLFVAGNRSCGNYNIIVWMNFDLTVIRERHAGQGAHRLALAARGDDNELLGGVSVDKLAAYQQVIGDIEIAELGADTDHVLKASAHYGDLPAQRIGNIDYLLHSVNIGGEGRNDYAAPARLPEEHLKGFADLTLALGITGSLRIGRVRQQAKDALAAELRKPRKVYHTAVDGGAVYLEVTRLNHHAAVALDGEGYGVGYRVIDMYHLNGERAELYHVAGGDLMELRAAEQPVLLELALDEADGELCAVNGDIDRLEQV